LPAHARLLTADGVRRLVISAEGGAPTRPTGVEVITLPRRDRQLAPMDIVAALADRGLKRLLIEGGADTVSRFLTARCLDRLHVMVAPVILGSGRPSVALPPIARADEALRVPTLTHRLGDEVLFDCDLSSQRAPIGRANTST
jgi:riboflavin biosynthesis pyrimidine reductase